jgi:hypothetical protein
MTTYVVNTNTLGISEFTITPNAIAALDGEVYFIDATSIYKYSGTSDNGTNIDCYIESGYVELLTNEDKRFPTGSVYLSYDSDCTGTLTLYNSTNGVDDTDYYDVPIDATYPYMFRPTLWDGMKARYWKFKLANTNGADFKLEKFLLAPYPVGRRIR